MVTQRNNERSIAYFNLLSTDTKPTDCPNGSIAIETDTGKEFRFDKENSVWHEFGYMRW